MNFANFNIFNVIFLVIYSIIVIGLPIVERVKYKDSEYITFGIMYSFVCTIFGFLLGCLLTPFFAIVGVIIIMALLCTYFFDLRLSPIVSSIIIVLLPLLLCGASEIGQSIVMEDIPEDRFVCVAENELVPLDDEGHLIHFGEDDSYEYRLKDFTTNRQAYINEVPVDQVDGAHGVLKTLEAYPETPLEKAFSLTVTEYRIVIDPEAMIAIY